MPERTNSYQNHQDPRPSQIFDAAARLSRRGPYQGTFNGQPISIEFNELPDYGQQIKIAGPMVGDVVVVDLYETYESSAVQHIVDGNVPENILEILSGLKPQKRS